MSHTKRGDLEIYLTSPAGQYDMSHTKRGDIEIHLASPAGQYVKKTCISRPRVVNTMPCGGRRNFLTVLTDKLWIAEIFHSSLPLVRVHGVVHSLKTLDQNCTHLETSNCRMEPRGTWSQFQYNVTISCRVLSIKIVWLKCLLTSVQSM